MIKIITFNKACEIANEIKQEQFPDFEYSEVTETDDRWAFLFSRDTETIMTPAPMFFVFKKDGRVEWFSIPPLDNLYLLQKGKKVKFII